MVSYKSAEAVAKVAEKVIRECYPFLVGVPIVYLFRDPPAKISCAHAEETRDRYGRMAKVSALVNGLLFACGLGRKDGRPYVFLMETAEASWNEMTSEDREAYVDHELGHAGIKLERAVQVNKETGAEEIIVQPKLSKDGEPRYFMAKHDLEEFNATYRRRGAWRSDIEDFEQICETLRGLKKAAPAAKKRGLSLPATAN